MVSPIDWRDSKKLNNFGVRKLPPDAAAQIQMHRRLSQRAGPSLAEMRHYDRNGVKVFGYGATIVGFRVEGFSWMSVNLYEDEFADLVDLFDDAKPLFKGDIEMRWTGDLLRNDKLGHFGLGLGKDAALPKGGGLFSPLADAPERLGS
jgi:hypothetical protein